ncbi:MAG TPA: helix-turn-helix transcriptional regulator [Syntrophales bacterium]|nr:helix-turn-helix transcriptional regulator [Syntrophales bacterium]
MGNAFEGFTTVQKVKAFMAANDMNMQALADYLKISIGTVSNRFEKNDWTVPELKLLAERFGTTIVDLI